MIAAVQIKKKVLSMMLVQPVYLAQTNRYYESETDPVFRAPYDSHPS